jgi:hypothetical protein
MKGIIDEKRLTIINLIIFLYLLSVYLLYIFEVDTIITGFFVELFTIPFLLAQLVFLIIGIKFLIKNKSVKIVTKVSVFLIVISSIITIGSVFI